MQEPNQEISDIMTVMSTAAGKQLMWRILSVCQMYVDDYTDERRTLYNMGKRAVGLEILQMLEDADPTLYPRLQLEIIKLGADNE